MLLDRRRGDAIVAEQRLARRLEVVPRERQPPQELPRAGLQAARHSPLGVGQDAREPFELLAQAPHVPRAVGRIHARRCHRAHEDRTGPERIWTAAAGYGSATLVTRAGGYPGRSPP